MSAGESRRPGSAPHATPGSAPRDGPGRPPPALEPSRGRVSAARLGEKEASLT